MTTQKSLHHSLEIDITRCHILKQSALLAAATSARDKLDSLMIQIRQQLQERCGRLVAMSGTLASDGPRRLDTAIVIVPQ